jgi:demethylmenaquinone methyltransferase/2-methoxy-6-polyprenyl-1,4-benzoquinol methylase
LNAGQNVLDVGTGTGILIPFLIKLVGPSGSITAIDYAENMVQICSTKWSHLKNVTVKIRDIEQPGLPHEHYDAITCFGIFPHIVDKGKALRQMNQLLKSGGKLIIAHALSSEEIRTRHKITSSPVFYDDLPEKLEMEQLLKQAGFVNFHFEDKPGHYLCMSTKPWTMLF